MDNRVSVICHFSCPYPPYKLDRIEDGKKVFIPDCANCLDHPEEKIPTSVYRRELIILRVRNNPS